MVFWQIRQFNLEIPCIVVVILIGLIVWLWPYFFSKTSYSIGKSFTKQAIMTTPEIVFFEKIRRAVPDMLVFPQVAMSGIVTPICNRGDSRFFGLFNQISQKRIDYVVCNPKAKYEVVCIIELDDASHDAEKDKRRDAITRDAGHVTLRFRNARTTAIAEIRKAVLCA
jgi:hypothetical protein